MKYIFYESIDRIFRKNKNVHIIFFICYIIMYIYLKKFDEITMNEYISLFNFENWLKKNELISVLFVALIYSYTIYITILNLYTNFNKYILNLYNRIKRKKIIIYNLFVNICYVLLESIILVITFCGINESIIEIIVLIFANLTIISFSVLLLCSLIVTKNFDKIIIILFLNMLYFFVDLAIFKYIIAIVMIGILYIQYKTKFELIIERK